MLSVGIDSIEISRIEKSLDRENFINKIYSPDEQIELERINYKPESAAAIFAAKEAFFKAIKTGILRYPFTDISILHEESGAPYIVLRGRLLEEITGSFSVSITHTDTTATAVVIREY